MKLINQIFISVSCIVLMLLSGCGARKIKARQLMNISIGMQKQQVLKNLGEPSVVRGSMTNKFDQVIEVWEYSVTKGQSGEYTACAIILTICTLGLYSPLLFYGGHAETFWVYFHNDKLVQWCKAGDWETAAHNIQEIRFR